jgi:CRP-like cAMP-binding protein
MIDQLIMTSEGAAVHNYVPGEIIFSAGETPLHFHHISKGEVKLQNKDGAAKELVQEIKSENQSIAEFSLFVNEPYPVTAIAMTDCVVIKLPKQHFFSLLNTAPEMNMHLLRNMSSVLHSKFLMADVYFKQNASEKIIILLDFLKRKHTDSTPYSFQVLMTRSEIANLAGLRVETVIRTIKKLEKENVVKVIGRKIFY